MRENLAEVQRRTPILEIFGPHFTQLLIYELGRSSAPAFDFGACPSDRCLHLAFGEIQPGPRGPTAEIRVTGEWTEKLVLKGPFIMNLPLIKGCSAFFRSQAVDLSVAVLDDRAAFLRVAAALSPGTRTQGIQVGQSPCPPS